MLVCLSFLSSPGIEAGPELELRSELNIIGGAGRPPEGMGSPSCLGKVPDGAQRVTHPRPGLGTRATGRKPGRGNLPGQGSEIELLAESSD